MHWKELSEFFGAQYDALFNDYPSMRKFLKSGLPPGADWGDFMTEFEEENRPEVRKAIRHFAKTGKWPKMSPIAAALVKERLTYASEFVKHLSFIITTLDLDNPRPMTKYKTICWFLIDVWETFAFEDFTDAMRSIPLPEYMERPPRAKASFGNN